EFFNTLTNNINNLYIKYNISKLLKNLTNFNILKLVRFFNSLTNLKKIEFIKNIIKIHLSILNNNLIKIYIKLIKSYIIKSIMYLQYQTTIYERNKYIKKYIKKIIHFKIITIKLYEIILINILKNEKNKILLLNTI